MSNLVCKIRAADLFSPDISYIAPLFEGIEFPWEILPRIKEYVKKLVSVGIDGFTEYAPGVLVGKNVKISHTATIDGPAIIGNECELRPDAYIRGNVITGPDCVLGHSSELKNAVLLRHVQVPHYNYVGDSILGNNSHLGAGTVCSNLKADGRNVVVRAGEGYATGLRKVGAFVGDGADIGCGCVLNPGTVIGRNTSVYPLISLRGVFPENVIVKACDNIEKRLNRSEGNSLCAG